jgi:hypothetical protein
MAEIIRDRVFPRASRPDRAGSDLGTVVILPVVRLESYADQPRPPRRRAPRKGAQARRALKELRGHVCSATCALAYLRSLARANPDPRAVAALMRHADRCLIGDAATAEAGLAWAATLLRELAEK